jgi:hypothetical protein
MGLKEYTESLTENNRIHLAIKLIERLLPVWNEFSNNRKNLEYVDTVVGMAHSVDKEIIQLTVNLAKKWINGDADNFEKTKLNEWYSDPIVALQDLDWEIPENIQLIFYSAYNLLGKFNGETKTIFGDEQLYLVINQAVDAILKSNLMTDRDINELLNKHKAPNKG